jgi:hypothetical protein
MCSSRVEAAQREIATIERNMMENGTLRTRLVAELERIETRRSRIEGGGASDEDEEDHQDRAADGADGADGAAAADGAASNGEIVGADGESGAALISKSGSKGGGASGGTASISSLYAGARGKTILALQLQLEESRLALVTKHERVLTLEAQLLAAGIVPAPEAAESDDGEEDNGFRTVDGVCCGLDVSSSSASASATVDRSRHVSPAAAGFSPSSAADNGGFLSRALASLGPSPAQAQLNSLLRNVTRSPEEPADADDGADGDEPQHRGLIAGSDVGSTRSSSFSYSQGGSSTDERSSYSSTPSSSASSSSASLSASQDMGASSDMITTIDGAAARRDSPGSANNLSGGSRSSSVYAFSRTSPARGGGDTADAQAGSRRISSPEGAAAGGGGGGGGGGVVPSLNLGALFSAKPDSPTSGRAGSQSPRGSPAGAATLVESISDRPRASLASVCVLVGSLPVFIYMFVGSLPVFSKKIPEPY